MPSNTPSKAITANEWTFIKRGDRCFLHMPHGSDLPIPRELFYEHFTFLRDWHVGKTERYTVSRSFLADNLPWGHWENFLKRMFLSSMKMAKQEMENAATFGDETPEVNDRSQQDED